MSRRIQISEAYRGLRNEGVDPLAAGIASVLWWLFGVEVVREEIERTKEAPWQ